jgi:hypothetical protein
MTATKELFKRLSGDPWRIKNPFREDILQANALLHNTAATEAEMSECMMLWCKLRQPCQFGKMAANDNRIHFAFLTEKAISEWSDEELAALIGEEKKLWKQRAAFDPGKAAHSFVLVVASPRVAFAVPDQHLRAFSDRILELANWQPDRHGTRRVNTITSDFLYLKNPKDYQFYGFQFNADFFACAGDGRWWRDHRIPGGIAFTANSTGHMIAFREWYRGKDDGHIWALKQAMLTVNSAEPTRKTDSQDPVDQGKATWLIPLKPDGKPLVEGIACPLGEVPSQLKGKDWTRYEGVLHTDHAVREEFFLDREIAPTSTKPYLMELTYLFDKNLGDFVEFTGGKPFAIDEIYAEIGRPEEWTHREADAIPARSETDMRLVAEQLYTCQQWGTLEEITDES